MRVLEALPARQRWLVPPVPAQEAVTTWRYLRLAIVLLVAGLAASVLYEHARTQSGCWRQSISAYYYTPAQGVLVGTLVAIGICLVCLKGSTDWEDVLLNVAGSCAPVVAFVPTPDIEGCGSSAASRAADLGPNIANNVTALLVAGGLALAVLGAVWLLGRSSGNRVRPTRTALAGFVLTVVLYLATLLVFLVARRWFTDWGHDVFAVAMFAFVFANVWLNAVNLYYSRRESPHPAAVVNRYTVIGILMTMAVVVTGLLGLLAHWGHWKLGIEASLIGVFGVFWVMQTAELWNNGLRTPDTATSTAR